MSDTPAITQSLLDGIAQARAAGRAPLVVLDLDGTLYDNTPRTLRILQEFTHAYGHQYPELYDVIGQLSQHRMEYKIADTLRAAGINDDAVIEDIGRFWFKRFFTNEYVMHDLPLAGSVQFVEMIHKAGGVPTYLTGRDAPNMLQGTIATLQRDGFPVGRVDTRTILKQDFETPDLEYKRSVVAHLRDTGVVVGAFDNEPGIANLFKEAFPEATCCWLDTSHAPGAAPKRDDVHTIVDFRELLSV